MAQALLQQDVFACLSCTYRTSLEGKFLDHVKIHVHENNFKIPCSKCYQKFTSVRAYKQHMQQKHITQPEVKQVTETETFWLCQNCEQRQLITQDKENDFLDCRTHLFQHSRKKELVHCPVTVPMCKKTFQDYRTFNAHINQHIVYEEFDIIEINLVEDINESFVTPTDSGDIGELNVSITNSDNDIGELNVSITDSESEIVDSNLLEDNATATTIDNESHNAVSTDLCTLDKVIQHTECLFALKMDSKHLLPRHVIDEILSFSNQIHELKLEYINEKLKQNFSDKENLKVSTIVDDIDLIDDAISLKEKLSTPFRRDKLLKTKFDFITPQRKVIKTVEGVTYFYYSMPVDKTLGRFLNDDSLRCGIFGFCLHSFPQNERKIYKLVCLSLYIF